MEKNLTKRKIAVVTGAAQGIGRAILEGLQEDGFEVVGVDLPEVDLSDPEQVKKFFSSLEPVSTLVNCAGGVVGQVHHPLEEITPEQWQAILNANLQTTFLCTQAVLPGMKSLGSGRIINISSGAGLRVSLTGIQAYATAKAAQIGFTRQMAFELGKFAITVNSIAPGFVLSNPNTIRQWESYGSEGQAKLVAQIPTGRLGTGQDIANGVRFFASPASDWVTGQVISIDGGHSLH